MTEDCRLMDTTHVPLAEPFADAAGRLAYGVPASAPIGGEVLAFRRRSETSVPALDALDRHKPALADDQWRRRISGLQKLNQRKARGLRVMWPANDRGRKTTLDMKSTLPLHILTAAVVAFAAGLGLAGAGSIFTHPELVPALTGWLH